MPLSGTGRNAAFATTTTASEQAQTSKDYSRDEITGPGGIGFPPELESAFRDYRYQLLRDRVPAIGWSGLLIFLSYALFDIWAMSEGLSLVSVLLRLLVVCPLVIAVLWAVGQRWSYSAFMLLYGIAYTVSCISVAAIVIAARLTDTFLPDQGLLLMILFGYFLMLMPTRIVAILSIALSALYLAITAHFATDLLNYGYQCVFFATANALGIVGSLVQERNMRQTFLTERQLEHSRLRLLEESSRKTLMLASAGHDLKQPLLAILLLVDDLESQPGSAPLQGSLDKLRTSIRHLGRLTESLMEATHLDEGRIKPRVGPVDLSALLRSVLREYEARTAQKGMRVVRELPPALHVDTDPLLLGRILRNLIDNAIKHGQPGNLTVRLLSLSTQASIEIADDGRGIDSKEQAAIFAPFYRSQAGHAEGLGLGLSIVRQLCDLLSIPITLQSAVGQGTSFRLLLPLSANQDPANESLQVLVGTLDPELASELPPLEALLNRWGMHHRRIPATARERSPAEHAEEPLGTVPPADFLDANEPPASLEGEDLTPTGSAHLLIVAGSLDQYRKEIASLRHRLAIAVASPVILLRPQSDQDGVEGIQTPVEVPHCLSLPLKPARLRLMIVQVCADLNLRMANSPPDPTPGPS